MKKKKNNSVHNPSVSEVRDKRADLQEFLSKLASGEIDLSNKKETAKDRMDVVRKEIELMRSEYKLPYKVICEVLNKTVGLILSETTLRDYCIHIIGIPAEKKKRKVSKAEAVVEAKVVIEKRDKDLGNIEERSVEKSSSIATEHYNPIEHFVRHPETLRKEKEAKSPFAAAGDAF